MLVSNPMKFHPNILNSFQVTERTKLNGNFCYFPFKGPLTREICNLELRFLCSAHPHMLVDIHVPIKFHHGIFNGFQDTEWTRLVCLFGYFQFQRAITRKI